ncbi:MAG: hypothetical protein IJ563_03880 [Selenomonadaceae bacterium]|nr:hypothetical protein [Selenomonadaceae bacterium]MBR1859442.1 hypothetical protein [Selenomonadaceae bacterium]
MMRDIFFVLLMISLLCIIVSVGAIIFANITKKPNKKFIRAALESVVLFVIASAGLILTK